MNTQNIIYTVGTVVVLAGAALKVLHSPYAMYGEALVKLTFIGLLFNLVVVNKNLRKKIQQLQGNK